VTVQRFNDVDAREHRWIVMFCNQQKRPHRRLPFCLGLITSASGTFEACRRRATMSVHRV
jgi:hypothetical protein